MKSKMTKRVAPRQRKRGPWLALAGVAILALIAWCAFSGKKRAPVGTPCPADDACRSGICLPDADPAEVANFLEIAKAYELGRQANPSLVDQIDELLVRLPRSSLTLRPVFPGVCTRPCTADTECPSDMFCADAVWVGAFRGVDLGRVQVCMPDAHPAARLMR